MDYIINLSGNYEQFLLCYNNFNYKVCIHCGELLCKTFISIKLCIVQFLIYCPCCEVSI